MTGCGEDGPQPGSVEPVPHHGRHTGDGGRAHLDAPSCGYRKSNASIWRTGLASGVERRGGSEAMQNGKGMAEQVPPYGCRSSCPAGRIPMRRSVYLPYGQGGTSSALRPSHELSP